MAASTSQHTTITLAVFPFENLTPGSEADILCKSVCIDLITELSRFRQFYIISFDSVKHINTDTVSEYEFVEHMKPDYFVRGSFRSDQNHIRINAQLLDSRTQRLIWADRFDGDMEQLLEMQEDLLRKLVASLQKYVNCDLLSAIRNKPKTSLKAYECWLYGMDELQKGTLESDLKAREYFRQAIEIDPNYSLAYSGMSLSYFNEWTCQLWNRWEISQNGSYQWAQKAIELDEYNYVAAYVLGRVFVYQGAYASAEHYLRKSLRLNPNDPSSLITIAICFNYLGYTEEALKLYERAVQLNPICSERYHFIGAIILFELGEYRRALELTAKCGSIPYMDSELFIAAVWYELGDMTKMQVHWHRFLETYTRVINKGEPCEPREAMEWMFKINPYRKSSRLERLYQSVLGNEVALNTPSKPNKLAAFHFTNNIFQKRGDIWQISFEGMCVQLTEVKGFINVQQLLTHPGQPVHCAELMEIKVTSTGEPVLDKKAKQSYRKKILDLQQEIAQAESDNDLGRLQSKQEEYERIVDHLSSSIGLNGRIRHAGNPIEKARSAVTWRIRSAISKIEQEHPSLGKHLTNAIRTGTFCSYEPEKPVKWVV